MGIKTITIKSVIDILKNALASMHIEIKHFDKLIEMYNAASYRAEGAIRSVLALLAALVSSSIGVTLTNSANPIVHAAAPYAVAAANATITQSLDVVLFSFRAMSKNNSMIYNSIEGCFHLFKVVNTDTVWAMNDILNKGHWA